MGYNSIISRLEGIILAGLYVGYIFYLSKSEKNLEELFQFDKGHNHKRALSRKARYHIYSASGILLSGILVLLVAAHLVVKNAILFADILDITQTFIGTMIIGISTALPEFTTALIGIKRGAKNLSLGVLIGSNITNPMFALGLGAIIAPLSMPSSIQYFDIPFWFILSGLALLFFQESHRMKKWQAATLVLSYLGYAAFKFYLI